MREGFDDTRVREEGLERTPLYRTLTSMEFSIFLMFLIGIATLIAALFPQAMDESFYVAEFGERLYHIYDSLGLFSVLRSWWFMLLFVLLFAALIFCNHARVREGIPRGTKGTRIYEADFSVPKPTEDVLLIFPVLLSSIGFRKRRIITGEGHWEILAERGIHPSLSSLLLHLSAIILLLGIFLTYAFSWGGSINLELGKPLTVPFQSGTSRWAAIMGENAADRSNPNGREPLRIELLKLTSYYGPLRPALAGRLDGLFQQPGSIPAEQLFVREQGKELLLKKWESRLSLARGKKTEILDLSTGESELALGLRVSQGPISRTAYIAFPALGETLRLSLPTNMRFETAQVSALPSQVPPAGRIVRFESSGILGQRTVHVRVLPSGATGDSVNVPREHGVDLGIGEEVQFEGLSMKLIRFSDWSLIRFRSDPGWRFVKWGALLIFLFTSARLYVYCYVLRAEISGAKGGSSHLSLRIRTSGLFASPAGIARKIADLLAK